MKKQYKRLCQKMKMLQGKDLFLIGLLGSAAFLKSLLVVLFEAGILESYFNEKYMYFLPSLFLFSGLFSIGIGFLLFRLKTRLSSFPIHVLGWLLFLLLLGFLFSSYFDEFYLVLGLFLFPVYLLFEGCFWSVILRFIVPDFDSKRFLFVSFSEMTGYIFCGAVGLFFSSFILQNYTLIFTGIYVLFMGVLKGILKFPRQSVSFPIKPAARIVSKQESRYALLYKGQIFLYFSFYAITFFLFYLSVLENSFLKGFSPFILVSLNWLILGVLSSFFLGLVHFHRSFSRLETASFLFIGELLLFSAGLYLYDFPFIFLARIGMFILNYFFFYSYFSSFWSAFTRSKKFHSLFFLESLIAPLGILLASLYIYFFSKAEIAFLLILSGALFSIGFFFLVQEYSRILLLSFKNKKANSFQFLILNNKAVFRFVMKGIESKSPEKALYFLNVLERAKHPILESVMSRFIDNPSVLIRERILFFIQKYRYEETYPLLRRRLKKETDFFLRQEIAWFLMGEFEGAQRKRLQYRVEKEDYGLAFIMFHLTEGGKEQSEALSKVKKLQKSSKVKERKEAAFVCRKVRVKSLIPLLEDLLFDKSFSVRKEALRAAPALFSFKIFKGILCLIENEKSYEDALHVLKKAGAKTFPFIKTAFLSQKDMDEKRADFLIKFIFSFEKEDIEDFLYKLFPALPPFLQQNVLERMYQTHFLCMSFKEQRFFKKVFEETLAEVDFLENQRLLLTSPLFLKKHPKSKNQFYNLQERLEKKLLISLYYSTSFKILKNALKNFLEEKEDLYIPSLGIIEDVLPKKKALKIQNLLKLSKNIA